ncbi:MAG: FAD-binding oxidoreductase [Acidimicrobiaceae bacterium]|nr:FAD-binding oxidoreductase [Acidimicrobiaceae bacterium]
MAFVAGLRSNLGAAGVLTGPDTAPYLTDQRGSFTGEALAVVRPASADETVTVVRACAAAGIAIVPQGGNTGMSGGSVPMVAGRSTDALPHTGRDGDDRDPSTPSIVLSMGRMNRIVSVDPDRWTITVEAGATIESVQQAASAANRLFGPDWGARGIATVGGAISTDAGGNNVVRYGNMRDNVLGLEAVLADGQVWDGLRALRKDSSGYDLKHLFIGAEGTLGVVTQAVLRLHPTTPHIQSALASISGLDRLMALLELAMDRCGGDVTALELMPVVGLERVCEKFDLARPLVTCEEFCVLVRLASAEPVAERLGAFLAEASERGWVRDAAVAVTEEQETRLWTIRDELSPMFLWEQHKHGVKLDTAVPIDLFGAYHDEVRRIAADLAPGALSYGFGHVGDGNLHMYVLPTRDDQVAPFLAVRDELRERIDEATFAFGGTLSAEHGIGQLLRDRIRPQKPAVEWELMQAVKNALDPQGIMNPHKTLPP